MNSQEQREKHALESIQQRQSNCPHNLILMGEVCLDCGKDMWG